MRRLLSRNYWTTITVPCYYLLCISRPVASFSTNNTNRQQQQQQPKSIALTPVQQTSLLVAFWRHLETNQASLIQDHHASRLVETLLTEKQRQDFQNSPMCTAGTDILAVRTKAIDDWLLLATESSHIIDSNKDDDDASSTTTTTTTSRQLVNLGAGMCARYHRLGALLQTRYDSMWEVDSDLELLKIKKMVLDDDDDETRSPSHDLTLRNIEADLSSKSFSSLESNMMESLFNNSNKPTDWIVEGVLEYLDPHQHQTIFDFTSRMSAAPNSRMVCQVLEEPLRVHFSQQGASDLPWKELPPLSTFIDCAQDCGWDIERIIRPNDWKGIYNRDVSYIPGFNMVFLKKC